MVADTKFYDMLEISSSANQAEIKKAYRKLAMKYHPDKGGDSEKFKEISEAFETLSDPEKRQMYDQFGTKGPEMQNGRGFPGMDPMDIFKNFFNTDSPFSNDHFSFGNHSHRPDYKQVELRISLEDLYNGKETRIKISRQTYCEACEGIGSNSPPVKCGACGGQGKVRRVLQIGPGMVQQSIGTCDKCSGQGICINRQNRCGVCNGTGSYQETHEITLEIKPGTPDGEKILLRQHGDYMKQFKQYSDLLLILKQKKHSRIKRKGNDLILEHYMSLTEALCGFKFAYVHLDNNTYIISNDKHVIKPNELFAVKNMGMPKNQQKTTFGNLYIKFDIDFPDKIKNKNDLESILGAVTECDATGPELKIVPVQYEEEAEHEPQCRQQ